MRYFIASFLLLSSLSAVAQHPVLPQQAISQALAGHQATAADDSRTSGQASPAPSGIYQFMKRFSAPFPKSTQFESAGNRSALIDTVVVGAVPNDTLDITGTYFNNGPIIVINDGVIRFHNAQATILGDVLVTGNGKFFADSSTLSFPQLYFYQRSWLVVNDATLQVQNCTLDFSGLSHNLAVSDNGAVNLFRVTNLGFTTAGAYLNGSITIDSTNQAGEFIMKDQAQFNFARVHTLLLWHHIPGGAAVNTQFPSGASVPNYTFDSATPGVSGIGYTVQVDSSGDVMWALMPENNSDVTISNSTIRSIGTWFIHGDTASVSGLVNNSSYAAFTAPLNDRTLQLNNSSVQTWSLYVFDTSRIQVTGCIIGELGTLGNAQATCVNVFCDGSGGYFWASDQSFCIAIGTSVSSFVRSERNGILLYGYGTVNMGASALGSSVLIAVQSNLPSDPVPYDNAIAWLLRVDQPASAFADSVVAIPGSAWIEQGPMANWMDLDRYQLWYSPAALNPPQWTAIGPEVFSEVHASLLGNWDTHGLLPGTYNIRLNTFNTAGDSIEAVRSITLLPSVLGVAEPLQPVSPRIFPMPAHDVFRIDGWDATTCTLMITDLAGAIVQAQSDFNPLLPVDISRLAPGVYTVTLISSNNTCILPLIRQ